MNFVVLSALAEIPQTVSDRLLLGGKMALLGMGIVFSVLLILIGVLQLFKLFFHILPNRKKASSQPEIAVSVAPEAPISAPAVATDNGELVAAITAALHAYRASDNNTVPDTGFRVVSFRKRK